MRAEGPLRGQRQRRGLGVGPQRRDGERHRGHDRGSAWATTTRGPSASAPRADEADRHQHGEPPPADVGEVGRLGEADHAVEVPRRLPGDPAPRGRRPRANRRRWRPVDARRANSIPPRAASADDVHATSQHQRRVARGRHRTDHRRDRGHGSGQRDAGPAALTMPGPLGLPCTHTNTHRQGVSLLYAEAYRRAGTPKRSSKPPSWKRVIDAIPRGAPRRRTSRSARTRRLLQVVGERRRPLARGTNRQARLASPGGRAGTRRSRRGPGTRARAACGPRRRR